VVAVAAASGPPLFFLEGTLLKKTSVRGTSNGCLFVGLSVESKQYAAFAAITAVRVYAPALMPGKKVVCSRSDHPVATYFVPAI